jgi:hypothetical protein
VFSCLNPANNFQGGRCSWVIEADAAPGAATPTPASRTGAETTTKRHLLKGRKCEMPEALRGWTWRDVALVAASQDLRIRRTLSPPQQAAPRTVNPSHERGLPQSRMFSRTVLLLFEDVAARVPRRRATPRQWSKRPTTVPSAAGTFAWVGRRSTKSPRGAVP